MSNSNPSAAQQEYNDLIQNNTRDHLRVHPEDRKSSLERRDSDGVSEEDTYRNSQIDAAMRMPALDHATGTEIKLPPASFDSGRSTGVKGVIADARNYEAARRSKWTTKVRAARRSIFGLEGISNRDKNESGSRSRSGSETDDEETALGKAADFNNDDSEIAFLEQWRLSRRKELETETSKGPVKNRRTSPSVRTYGRMDEVDALGYLDAIEKVRRDTRVVVFVYDPECVVSATIEAALMPIVFEHPHIHFVKVHCDDIEFDNAAVPALLAYKNQGDLFANLTGLVEMIPDDEDFGTESLNKILRQHQVL